MFIIDEDGPRVARSRELRDRFGAVLRGAISWRRED